LLEIDIVLQIVLGARNAEEERPLPSLLPERATAASVELLRFVEGRRSSLAWPLEERGTR
jgi:hypothetical protein